MGRGARKIPAPDARATPESLQVVVARQGDTTAPVQRVIEAPFYEFVAGAVSAVFARPGNPHPMHLTRGEIGVLLRVSFDLAEDIQQEYRRRYGQ